MSQPSSPCSQYTLRSTKTCLHLIWGRRGFLHGRSIHNMRPRQFLVTLTLWATRQGVHPVQRLISQMSLLFLSSLAARGHPDGRLSKMEVSIWPTMHLDSVLTGFLYSSNQQTAIFHAKGLNIQTSTLITPSKTHFYLSHKILCCHSCPHYK